MEILTNKNHQDLLNYLPHLKASLKEWMFVEVRLSEDSDKDISIIHIAELIHATFRNNEGKLYVCNDREILMLLHGGKGGTCDSVAKEIEARLPEGSCEIHVCESTPEGLAKLELLITYRKPVTLAEIRRARQERMILIADDDMYMRTLVRKGATDVTVHEVSSGDEVMAAYKKYVPDILFLDIHMPNKSGTGVLQEVLAFDPNAYVVMLSSDSSRENVELTSHKGAKGFLAKPFTKDKLQDYIRKCPTIARAGASG